MPSEKIDCLSMSELRTLTLNPWQELLSLRNPKITDKILVVVARLRRYSSIIKFIISGIKLKSDH